MNLTFNNTDMTVSEFIAKNEGLVHKACRRYVPLMRAIEHTTGANYDDLYQIGMIGLLKAKERFSPDYGVKLSTYAFHMIVGEIKCFLRDNDMVKTPRMVKELHSKIKQLDLEDPSPESVAALFDISLKNAKLVLNYNPTFRSMSEAMFCYERYSEAVTLEETIYDEPFEGDSVNRLVLREFLATLTDTEKRVWFRYHRDGIKQTTLSKYFGVSQAQISRILTKIEKKAERFGRIKGFSRH
ncbi:putative sporulation sigma factor [Brevibacillus phage SecTim467]|uniref:Putative sporulation sigma factor n=2 Tax=Jenstvirus jenst TaxID=1982225 RepID=A0A0K2CPE3_9CAUD|nr:RNA polymerase sigma factor [Brevibacillus phage Jenst]ALA07209.1 putative sporulation sigma factor [Brevibacillus phage Jenst]ALA07429.1 putative sporulation sigma factor [Brevibacillus phage SecTim467]